MKALNIIASAYRATLEEQDDTIVWLTHAMKGAGADVDVLLRGNAVNYALPAQDASGLTFGRWKQTQPPQVAQDVATLIGKGVSVHAVAEDLDALGLEGARLIDGVQPIGRQALPELFGRYDRVWHW